jgi:hypothetical protein
VVYCSFIDLNGSASDLFGREELAIILEHLFASNAVLINFLVVLEPAKHY